MAVSNSARPPGEKMIIWMNIMCTFARIVGVAHDENHNSFWPKVVKMLPTTAVGVSFWVNEVCVLYLQHPSCRRKHLHYLGAIMFTAL